MFSKAWSVFKPSTRQDVLTNVRKRRLEEYNKLHKEVDAIIQTRSIDLKEIDPNFVETKSISQTESETAPSLVSMGENEAMSLHEEKSISLTETEVSSNVNTIDLDEPIPVKKRRTRKKPVKETITQSEYFGPEQTQEEIDQSQNKALGIVAGGIAAAIAVGALSNPSTGDSAPNNAPHLDIPEEL